jgi:3'(2'), 5'-bisphosphate nucleotidase
MSNDLSRELDLATRLAREAGEVTLKYHRTEDLEVQDKGVDDPVTRADKEAEEVILPQLHEHFPQDGLLSEEAEDKTSWRDHKRSWIVDPLDGTKDFVLGFDGYSVMIGLLEGGRPVLGVVHQPVTGLTFRAAGDHAEVVDPAGTARPMRVSVEGDAARIRLVVSNTHRSERVDQLKKILDITDELKVGSVGIKISFVARNERDLYVHPTGHCKLWDTCAPEAILAAAGGRMTDLFGDPLRYEPDELRVSRGIVASNGAVHDRVVEAIRPIIDGVEI